MRPCGGSHARLDRAAMTRPLPLIAGVLGLVALALAALYGFNTAGSLPSFIPGFRAGSEHVHVNHAIGSLVVAIALFVLAWFLARRED
jgi:hypothetical protein